MHHTDPEESVRFPRDPMRELHGFCTLFSVLLFSPRHAYRHPGGSPDYHPLRAQTLLSTPSGVYTIDRLGSGLARGVYGQRTGVEASSTVPAFSGTYEEERY